jgi:hypothetical protein
VAIEQLGRSRTLCVFGLFIRIDFDVIDDREVCRVTAPAGAQTDLCLDPARLECSNSSQRLVELASRSAAAFALSLDEVLARDRYQLSHTFDFEARAF